MRVTFYRTVLNSYGKPYRSCLHTVEVPRRVRRPQAEAYAIREFEEWVRRTHHGEPRHWNVLAEWYEVH